MHLFFYINFRNISFSLKQGKQEEKKKSEGAGQITQNKWQKTSECKTIISEYKLNSSVRTQRLSDKI